MDREAVGVKIKVTRVKAKMTQEQLAEKADISSSYISAIERGKQSVSLEYLDRIADALQVPVTELLVYEKTEEYGAGDVAQRTVREKSEYEGRYIARQRKMNHINEMLSRCGEKEFQIVYDEISLLIEKFQYFSGKGIT